MSIKVTITDDHPVVLKGLQKILEEDSNIEVYDRCSNGDELLSTLRKRQPDVLLLDIQMPGKEGGELAKIITETYPQIAILILTNLSQTFHVRDVFLNGAKGYVLKSSDPFILTQAIESVHEGHQYIDPALRELMVNDMLEIKTTQNTTPILTKREKEILQHIANELTSQEIAQKLFISLSAVENHRLNLLYKLNAKNSVGLIKKAMTLGLIK